MRKHTVEQLERRQLLAVTINNGLPQSDPNYYEATLGRGSEPSTIMWENRNVVFEYTALLDLGANGAVGGAQVVELSDYGTDAVAGSAPRTAESVVTLILDDATANNAADNPRIVVTVTATIPAGETRLVTSYSFQSTGYDLKTANFFQYWDCVSGDVTSDFVKIRGTVATGNLELRTYNTDTYNYSILEDDVKTPSAVLTGFGVGEYPDYKPVITAGGYNPPATGDILIPAANFTGLGSGYGPVPFAVPVLEYGFVSSAAATINTSLTQAPAVIIPQMEVNWLNGTNEISIPDGSVVRDPMIGVDYDQLRYGIGYYTIRNTGRGDLQLFGDPIIQITGPNADAFRIIRQPLTKIAGGAVTMFAVQYLPTMGGVQTATISITSNDLEVTPYTFQVFGGSGSTVTTDAYENDGPNAFDKRAWLTQFEQVKAQARAISTQGVGQIHSIHAQTDVDWVRFTLENTANVTIETFAPVGDTRLYLYNEAGERITLDNDSGPGNAARIGSSDQYSTRALTLSPGTYYVRVDEAGNNSLVPLYELYVSEGSVAAAPPASIDAAGKLLVLGTTMDDAITVDIVNTSVRVVRNANTWYFPLSEVKSIEIRAGWGNDTVYVGPGIVASTVLGGLGDDAITYASNSNADIAGGAGNDYITGGAGNDHINAKDGNDTIDGGAGNDRLQGGIGNDLISGGDGNDDIMANLGNDTVHGEAGNDSIVGFGGDDSLFGDEGDDVIDGGEGRDYVDSGAGNDQITTWQDGQVDTIQANPAADLLFVDDNPASVLDVIVAVGV